MIRLLTIKPERGEVEYGVASGDGWVIHGVVISVEMTKATTLEDLYDLATQHAFEQGYVPTPAG
jgi:hypothetical protein